MGRKKEKQTGWVFPNILKVVLSYTGILAALIYFLGRLHIESYYYALGITPNVLSFSVYDYMVSSFDLDIMCLLVILFLYLYWHYATPDTKLFGGFPIKDKEKELEKIINDAQKKNLVNSTRNKELLISSYKRKENLIKSIINSKYNVFFLYFLWLLFFCWLFIVTVPSMFDGRGFIGFYAGYVIGLAAILFADKLYVRRGGKTQSARVFAVVLILLVSLPLVTNVLAKKEVMRDREQFFPLVTVIYKEEFPYLLSSLSSNSTNSVTGKLVITNNGVTYLTDNSTGKWQSCAIPEDSIKAIKYLPPN